MGSNDDRPVLGVVGATGAVGRVILSVLPMYRHEWSEVRLAAAADDVGTTVTVAGEDLTIQPLDEAFFDGVDVALVDIPPQITHEWVDYAAGRGVVVIDNSITYRGEEGVPLVVAEVNPEEVANRPRGIIANPGATVMTMIDALGVLHRGWGLQSLVVTSFQAASGLGRAGIARLLDEVDVVAGKRDLAQHPGDIRRLIEHELGDSCFPAPLALNVIPFVGYYEGAGWTSEEGKLRDETRKILGLPDLKVMATCVRVPVVSSHSISVHATFSRPIDVDRARRAIIEAPMVVLMDDPETGEFPTPVDVVGADPRFIGRLRQSPDFPRSLDFFVSGDNLRKGAGLNMLQTAGLVARELTGADPA
ncbi:MAG TPA: aspartate-semialdehyde dehydrogenase [Intrasporangiaceae bacterium]|nr:aspartate-semialdehyde dehydrogenase [Intrasporangiaceae bacterium]